MSRFRLRSWIPWGVLAGVLVVAAADPLLVQELRNRVFDGFQRLRPRAYLEAPVRIVDLDDASLERLGQWPWPRTRVAELVRRLRDLGAASIALDIVFAESDRTSPRNVLALWPEMADQAEWRARLETLPDHDATLAAAIRETPVVTGFLLTAGDPGPPPVPKAAFNFLGPDPRSFLAAYSGSVPNLVELEQAARGNGSFSIEADADGIYRRLPLLFLYQDRLYPALATEALRVAFGVPSYGVRSAGAGGERSFGAHAGITAIRVGQITVPTDEHGRLWLHYTEPQPQRFVPAWRVLSGEVERERIDGHVVFVGTSAAGLKDLRTTPLDPVAPGVVVHAEAAEQMLLRHFLVRPDWARGAEWLYVAVLGALLVLLLPWVGALGSAVVGIVALAGVLALSWHAFASWRWLLDPVLPSFAVLLVYLAGSLINYLDTEAQRRQIRHAFGHYLSPALVDELASHPERLRLGGEKREMTILFCDIRGFTTLSEEIESPEELTRLLNRFLTPMTQLIMDRRGTIDKYMGDCIMAFWNAPVEDHAHALHACETALAMLARLEVLNEELRAEAEGELPPALLRIGIGINTGSCCVGNMGSDQRFDYSVIGDEVNLASRLEGQCKTYGVSAVIGDRTRLAAPDFATLELDRIRVKGKQEAVRVHALVGDVALARRPDFRELYEQHEALLAAYRAQQWERALELVEACREREFGLDALYDLYAERIEGYRRDPPGADWDGVYRAETK